MSYAVGGKKKPAGSYQSSPKGGYNQINNTDDSESNSNDLENIKRQIEGNLSAIQLNIRKLEKLN